MPEKTVICEQCGSSAHLSFGEGGFGWWESLDCHSCGRTYEADGAPPTPDEYRQVMLREQGEWPLDTLTPVTVELMKAFREVLWL